MKLQRNDTNAKHPLFLTGIFLALTNLNVHAGVMGPVNTDANQGTIYFGAFGGGGSSTQANIAQYGTAFFIEAEGGPLAVNSFGRSNSRSVGIVGGQVGYQWLNSSTLFSNWSLRPAFEAEGYYLSQSNITGHGINNDTTRLPEHDFAVSYPTSGGVFLINSVLNFDSNSWLHPYVGAGIGGASLSISNAESIQMEPPEAGINHYNSNPNGKDATFAGQVKVGSTVSINQHFSVFAEYRWLYLAATSYTFGSTVYSTHSATSSWRVDLGSQSYNMGSAGIRYTV